MSTRSRWFAALVTAILSSSSASSQAPRKTLRLENSAAAVVADLGGGSIVDFHLTGGLNPLHWISPDDVKFPIRPMSHFLCLDRWGPPSDAELKNGMPFHGEASRVEWRVSGQPGPRSAAMIAVLPLAGLEVRRVMTLDAESPVLRVTETVTNRNKLGRMYNLVQHVTIGPPFLDETTVVDSNATRGLMQSSPLPNPEDIEIHWPEATKAGKPVDMRRLTDDPDPNVVSYIIEDDLGWVTATNSSKQLLIGYIFRKSDYPWLNLWRHVQNGHPLARGLEFGTTGLHQPFPILAEKPRIFGRPTYAYLDAGSSAARSYTAFQAKIPADFAGVAAIAYANGAITIRERGPQSRELSIKTGPLF